MNFRLFFYAAIFQCIFLNNAFAQSVKSRNHYKHNPLEFALVQLSTHQRKVAFYESNSKPAKAAEIKKDSEKVNNLIISDFNDNFDFRPVYYYYDSNASLITEGKFNGILLDNHLQPLPEAMTAKLDTNFVVIYYGAFIAADNMNNVSDGHSLIVLDNNLQQYPSSTPRSSGYSHTLWLSAYQKAYLYKSKYNINYVGSAKKLNKRFKKFYE